jgi:trk system potassium uptake protein TrkH
LNPLQKLICVYLSVLAVGGFLLTLDPFVQRPAGLLDHLFTATSAISTTGLIIVNVYETYSFGGELIVLLLLQLGGMGYMSVAGTFLLEANYGVDQDDDDSEDMVSADYSVPDRTNLREFVRKILLYTLVCETIGAIVLSIHFSGLGLPDAVWRGIFTAVSAFCTAGLHLFDQSLQAFTGDVTVNVTVGLLSLAGSFGFLFFSDVLDWVRRRKPDLSISTRVILLFMVISIVALSMTLFFSGRSIGEGRSVGEGLMVAIFMAISTVSTTGFSTVPVTGLGLGSIYLLIIFMFVGASPSGTGGGIKNTTLAAVVAFVVSVIRRKSGVLLFGKRLSENRVHQAIGVFVVSLFLVATITGIVLANQPGLGRQAGFEVVSALGTVGLSLGATTELSVWATALIMLLMMVGRLGALSVLMATIGKSPDTEESAEREGSGAGGEDIAIEG